MNLSKETIELIHEAFDSTPDDCSFTDYMHGASTALTNPPILKSANLYTQEQVNDLLNENTYLKAEFEANKDKVYTQEDCLGFAEWCDQSGYYYHKVFEIWVAGIDKKTTQELFTLYLKNKTT
jgi:hypothetical protein